MRLPFPKELLIEAWKAKVGYSFESRRTHEACDYNISKWSYSRLYCANTASVQNAVCMDHN